jgi:hypothetical protein
VFADADDLLEMGSRPPVAAADPGEWYPPLAGLLLEPARSAFQDCGGLVSGVDDGRFS